MLYNKQAISDEIQAYQKYINLLIYLINVLYIDITHSTSFLAWFMQNSFSIHAIEANHLIIYFHDWKWLLLIMNNNTDLSSESIMIFEDSSNAFYDDDLTTCWSSERYVFHLFDCSIDWQTIWQNMIMISTTEAELLTLTHADKQIMWWQQFFKQLDFDPSHEYMIHCDNEQIIDLINKTVSLISTKLCHINIHQYWLCEHVQNKIFTVEKLSINQILADSLMKSLSCQKHENFMQLLKILNLFFHWIFQWF